MRKDFADILREWKHKAKVDNIMLINAFAVSRNTLTICTSNPKNMIRYEKEYLPKIQSMYRHINKVVYINTSQKKIPKKLNNLMREWVKEAGIDLRQHKVLFGRNSIVNDNLIYVCSDRPGILIGKSGILVYKYQDKLNELFSKEWKFNFVETDSWYII